MEIDRFVFSPALHKDIHTDRHLCRNSKVFASCKQLGLSLSCVNTSLSIQLITQIAIAFRKTLKLKIFASFTGKMKGIISQYLKYNNTRYTTHLRSMSILIFSVVKVKLVKVLYERLKFSNILIRVMLEREKAFRFFTLRNL